MQYNAYQCKKNNNSKVHKTDPVIKSGLFMF